MFIACGMIGVEICAVSDTIYEENTENNDCVSSIMNHLQNSNLIAAAIGVTVGVISAAGIFIYHKILENQQQHTSRAGNLDAANKKIAELQAELDALRVQQSQKRKRKFSRKLASNDSTYTATDNDTDIEAFSTADTDIGDDEFYDCSDSESVISENDTRNRLELSQLDLMLKEIDEGRNEEFDIESYYKLQNLVKTHQNNVEVVWRFARDCYEYAETITDKNNKRMIILEGIEHCEKILQVQDPKLYKWYAILIGINGDYLSIPEKLKNGLRFKNYVELALEMEPNDSELHYLLGRFNYEMANITWIERKIAGTLFGEVPNISHEEALTCFEAASRLGNNTLQTQLYISKCYVALHQYSRAVVSLDKILEQPVLTTEDKKVHEDASKLLNKYSEYRS
ncbi:regulator of microtubule dynamics protein 1 isoform X2 [Andrena cerasifolii]|uniref:regulator of microtubule dynamics protein 1 isoform X2 n=1 Tax=Andrena cerasifolii TaxID=2819439 RepID=UPI004037DC88